MKRVSKYFLAALLLTVASVSWAGCPEGQKQTYKGCEPDSEMAAAHEAVRKAHELLQAAKTPEEREELEAAAVAAIEKTTALHAELEAQKEREQLALQARARADNQKAHVQTVQLVEIRQEAQATMADAQETLSAAATPEERAAAQELIAAAQSVVSVRNPNELTAAQADLATAQLSVLVTGSGNLSKNKLAEVNSIVAAQEKLLLTAKTPEERATIRGVIASAKESVVQRNTPSQERTAMNAAVEAQEKLLLTAKTPEERAVIRDAIASAKESVAKAEESGFEAPPGLVPETPEPPPCPDCIGTEKPGEEGYTPPPALSEPPCPTPADC